MGIIYFVRHGQASLGAQNYDQLSDLGFAQAEQLGLYFLQQKIQFEYVQNIQFKYIKIDQHMSPENR